MIVALLYLAAMAAYFYVWKEDISTGEPLAWIVLAGLALLHIATGAALRRWWAVALPLAAIAVAVPFGYGEGVGQEAPIWFYYGALLSLPALALVGLGVGGGRLYQRRR